VTFVHEFSKLYDFFVLIERLIVADFLEVLHSFCFTENMLGTLEQIEYCIFGLNFIDMRDLLDKFKGV
jgi:hypothetical protein